MRKSVIAKNHEIEITVADDGEIIIPAIAEPYAAGLADGETEANSWKLAGGADSARQLELRRALDQHPAFVARVEAYRVEKAAALRDEVYGQAVWMISLTFRECRAKRDKAGMVECAKMRLQAAQGVARMQEKAAPTGQSVPEPAKPAGQVGKPAEKSPQSSRNVDDIRRALLEKGVNVAPRDDLDEAV